MSGPVKESIEISLNRYCECNGVIILFMKTMFQLSTLKIKSDFLMGKVKSVKRGQQIRHS